MRLLLLKELKELKERGVQGEERGRERERERGGEKRRALSTGGALQLFSTWTAPFFFFPRRVPRCARRGNPRLRSGTWIWIWSSAALNEEEEEAEEEEEEEEEDEGEEEEEIAL